MGIFTPCMYSGAIFLEGKLAMCIKVLGAQVCIFLTFKKSGTSLVVQWLRLHAPNAEGLGSIPGQGTRSHMHVATKSSHATTKDPASRNQDMVQPNK